MKIKEIGHLAFTCKDLEESIRFYRDKLGFTNKFSIYYGEMLEHIRKSNPDQRAALWTSSSRTATGCGSPISTSATVSSSSCSTPARQRFPACPAAGT